MNRKRTFAMFCMAAIILLSCNLPGIAQRSAQKTQPSQDPGGAVQLPSTPAKNPTALQPTAAPTLSPLDCLAGSWEPGDLSPYVMAGIPPEMTNQAEITYKGTSGRVAITFSKDGKISLRGEQFKLLFDAKVSFLTLPLEVSLNGQANGSYHVSGNTLTTSNMDSSGLSASAKMAGQDLVDQATILSSVPMLNPPYNSATFTCSGSSLEMKLSGYPENLPPLKLKRVNP